MDDEVPNSELELLSTLLNGIKQNPDAYMLLAGTLASTQLEAESSELIFVTAEHLCLQRSESKKARQASIEISKARIRHARSVADFESLLMRQVEWEESIASEQVAGEEH